MQIDNPWQILKSFSTIQEASLVSDYLRDEGIETQVSNQNTNQILPHLSQIITVDVMVRKSKFNRAQEILAQVDENHLQNQVSQETSTEIESAKAKFLKKSFNSAVFACLVLPIVGTFLAIWHYGCFLKAKEPEIRDYSPAKASSTIVLIILSFILSGCLIYALFL